jgi:hypothetical protein
MPGTVVMEKREVKWIVALVALIGLYFLLFHDRFAKEQMVILPSLRRARRADATVWPVSFSLNDDFKLTSVTVIPWDGDNFNRKSKPVWQLISDSNSVPTRAFRYGQNIRGMKTATKGGKAEPLEPDVYYRLILEAGKVTAYKDFQTKATEP